MTYRVTSNLKLDGEKYVKVFDTYQQARKEAYGKVMCGCWDNVEIWDSNDIRCSFPKCLY